MRDCCLSLLFLLSRCFGLCQAKSSNDNDDNDNNDVDDDTNAAKQDSDKIDLSIPIVEAIEQQQQQHLNALISFITTTIHFSPAHDCDLSSLSPTGAATQHYCRCLHASSEN